MSEWPPGLTFEELCEACLRAEATNPPELAEAERRLYEAVVAAEKRGVKKTIASIVELTRDLPGTVTEEQLRRLRDQVAKAASIHLGPELAAQAQPAIVRAMDIAYRYGRQSVPLPSEGTGQAFNVNDQRALDWLQRDVMFWVGQSDQRKLVTVDGERVELGRFIATTVRDGVEAGESSTAIGRRVQKALAGQVAGQSDSYWRGLAANAATRASAFGMVEGFIQADITRYEILAVMDERTSSVCRELNGKVFEVRHAIQQRNRLMAAQSPDDVRGISPWVKAADVADLDQAGGTDALAAAGVALPPFHFHCRTTVVVAEAGYTVTSEAPVPPLPEPRVDEEQRTAFVEAFDPRSRDLYDTQWSAAQRGGVFRGQLIGPDGFAVGTEYRDPFMRGLRLSAWPTHAPTDLHTFWRPEPSPAGGRWLSVHDACAGPQQQLFARSKKGRKCTVPLGAIRGADFQDWVEMGPLRLVPKRHRAKVDGVLRVLATRPPAERKRGVEALTIAAMADYDGRLKGLGRWLDGLPLNDPAGLVRELGEAMEVGRLLDTLEASKVHMAMDQLPNEPGYQGSGRQGGYDILAVFADGTRRRYEVKTSTAADALAYMRRTVKNLKNRHRRIPGEYTIMVDPTQYSDKFRHLMGRVRRDVPATVGKFDGRGGELIDAVNITDLDGRLYARVWRDGEGWDSEVLHGSRAPQ